MKAATNGFHGQLRIALSDGITPSRLPALLAMCRQEEPEVDIRLFEVPLAQLTHLPTIFSILRDQPGKFIVFVDDLAFNDSCPEYTALKTVLEGGLEARPANVVVYATSNRRNIVRQRFSGRLERYLNETGRRIRALSTRNMAR